MGEGDRDDLKFLDTLSHDLASEVFDDETACEAALALGTDVSVAIDKAREVASKAMAEQRRARIAVLGRRQAATSVTARRYGDLSRAQLLKLLSEREAAVEHRDLTDVPDDDLRTLLEDLDAVAKDPSDEEQ